MNLDLTIAEWVNSNRIKSLDPFFILITDTASYLAYAMPVSLLIYALIKDQRIVKYKALQILSSILLSTVVVTTIKHIIMRKRPYEMDKVIEKLSVGGGNSFPSGHTADAFVIAISLTLIITKNKWILIPVWVWAFMVGYSRILLGVHYLSDVLFAIIIAGLCALLMNFIFRKKTTNV